MVVPRGTMREEATPLPPYVLPPYMKTKGLRDGVWRSIYDSKELICKSIDLQELAA